MFSSVVRPRPFPASHANIQNPIQMPRPSRGLDARNASSNQPTGERPRNADAGANSTQKERKRKDKRRSSPIGIPWYRWVHVQQEPVKEVHRGSRKNTKNKGERKSCHIFVILFIIIQGFHGILDVLRRLKLLAGAFEFGEG